MSSKNKKADEKWFFISFYSDGNSVFSGTSHFVVFRSGSKILHPFDENRPDIQERLEIIYQDVKYHSEGVVTKEELLRCVRAAFHVEELTADGKKIQRKDLIKAIYTKKMVNQFFLEHS